MAFVFSPRILIVDDEKESWSSSMRTLLIDKLPAEPAPRIELAHDRVSAVHLMARNHYHIISMDMMMPGSGGSITVDEGIELARTSWRGIARSSKLVVYSAYLHPEDRSTEGARIHDGLPKLDRYAKGALGQATTAGGLSCLTQGAWADRISDYLDYTTKSRKFGDDTEERATVVGAWLESAIKHCPPLLARHSRELSNWWDDETASARLVDAGLAFIEASARLALAQTRALLEHSRAPPPAWPVGATISSCLQSLSACIRNPPAELKRYSWWSYLKGVQPAFEEARALRNMNRHTLQPGAAGRTWQQLRPALLAVMDLAAYWTQHPLWLELRRGPQGWVGESLTGNGFPRARLELSKRWAAPDEAAMGGFWQSAVRVDGQEGVSHEFIRWGPWLKRDANQQACWLPVYTEARAARTSTALLDLDSGAFQMQFDRA